MRSLPLFLLLTACALPDTTTLSGVVLQDRSEAAAPFAQAKVTVRDLEGARTFDGGDVVIDEPPLVLRHDFTLTNTSSGPITSNLCRC